MNKNNIIYPCAALWRQLQFATQVMLQVGLGRSLSVALKQIDSEQKPAVQALVFACLRNWGKAQALSELLVSKKPTEPVNALLEVSLALLSAEQKMYDDFTLVNQTVEAAKRQRKTSGGAGFINACLRRFLREAEPLLIQVDQDLEAKWNHPKWWIELLQRDYPQFWQQILKADQQKAPMFLRVNTRQVTVADYLFLLQENAIAASLVGEDGVRLLQAVRVVDLPMFAQGWVSVQDIAAQQAARLLLTEDWLADRVMPRILDACAAPGGKTCHLLELAQVQVDALEIDPQRTEKIRDNLKRLGLKASVRTADVNQLDGWWDGQLYDAILLDAPCSASGVVRRHPDALWLKRASDINQLVQLQKQMLHELWPLLKVGGRLLYCTCSVFKSEGQNQISTFLNLMPDAKPLPSLGHLLPELGQPQPEIDQITTEITGGDGFFYALLEKTTY